MIGVGIVGCNYGRTVLIPAFRQDPRCEVVALAGTDAERTAELARAANVARGLGSWQAMVEEPAVAVIAVAVPPDLQPAIAQRALDLGKILQARGRFSNPRARARGPPLSISIFRSCRHGGARRPSWTMARSGACATWS